MRPGAITIARAYDAERRRLTRQRTVVASVLGLVLVPLFGTVDYFLYRPHVFPLVGARVLSCMVSAAIFMLLRRPLGRRYPSALAIALGLEVGLAIAVVPVAVTGADTPYVSLALLILSLAALVPWTATQLVFLVTALAVMFVGGAIFHGVAIARAFVTQVSAILVSGVIALVITVVSDKMRGREFAARRALRAASREKTRLIENLRQTTGELAALNQRLAALNQEMEDLLYVASHDLRAPLINVQGFAREVRLRLSDLRTHTNGAPQVGAIFADTDESLGFIDTAVHRMDGLIQGLLNVSRIATRTNPTDEVCLQKVVEKTIESFRYQLDQSHIQVTVGALPTVRGDTLRLTQVFSNLIDNAIKYMGDSATRRIEIGARDGNGTPTMFVRDTGPGIPPHSQEAVFRLFRRLANGAVAGEGLGLTMVRKIVEKHGGRIWIESTPGQGSTFCFTLRGAAAAVLT
ncbi:MAG TPA: ATP-binding protein [Candidatus Margulisiibacteriota bacterium]|nr:ATP-binding protein [Candidatus Margulisiibacteriota bacterium]